MLFAFVNVQARKQDFIVTQFHFTEWSIHGKPSDSSAMLMLLDMVNKAKINNGKAPITVTCKYVSCVLLHEVSAL